MAEKSPALASASFAVADADDWIIYNSTTNALFKDANGNFTGGAVQIALLTPGLALTTADFVVI